MAPGSLDFEQSGSKDLDQSKGKHVARQRRLQYQRASSRHLKWVLGLVQPEASHHTSSKMAASSGEAVHVVAALRLLLDEGANLLQRLEKVAPQGTTDAAKAPSSFEAHEEKEEKINETEGYAVADGGKVPSGGLGFISQGSDCVTNAQAAGNSSSISSSNNEHSNSNKEKHGMKDQQDVEQPDGQGCEQPDVGTLAEAPIEELPGTVEQCGTNPQADVPAEPAQEPAGGGDSCCSETGEDEDSNQEMQEDAVSSESSGSSEEVVTGELVCDHCGQQALTTSEGRFGTGRWRGRVYCHRCWCRHK